MTHIRITKRELDRLAAIAGSELLHNYQREFLLSIHRRLERASRPCVWKKVRPGFYIVPHGAWRAFEVAKYCATCGRKVKVAK